MNGRKEEWIGCEHRALYLTSASYFWSREDGWMDGLRWMNFLENTNGTNQ